MNGKARRRSLPGRLWKGFLRRIRSLTERKCRQCGGTGWISHETWVGARGLRTADRCPCGGPHLRFL